MRNVDIRADVYEACFDAMGVYPEKFGDKERTEWQEGWNAFGSDILKKIIELNDWIDNHKNSKLVKRLLKEGDVFIGFNPICLYYSSGDIFAWGYSDCEKIEEDMMKDVNKAFRTKWGIIKYHCRKYNEKPQWPIEKNMRKDGAWDLEDLPECKYDVGVRWTDKTRREAVEELGYKIEGGP